MPHAAALARPIRFRSSRRAGGSTTGSCGPTETPEPLALLAADLRKNLLDSGFELESRAFQAHVTLIRKAQEPRQLPPLPAIDWPVAEFVLVRSVLSRLGSSYEPIERFALDQK